MSQGRLAATAPGIGGRGASIRTAIRNQAERHAEATRRSVARKSLDLGLRHVSRGYQKAMQAAGTGLVDGRRPR